MPVTQTHPNGRRRSLGNSSNAGSSVTGRSHKPDEAAPFLKHHRSDIDGVVVIISQRFEGFTALVPLRYGGLIENPWTGKPFTNLRDCVKVTKYRIRRGYFPGLKPKDFKGSR